MEVVGADQLRRELRNVGDAGLKKELRDANKSAAQVVVEKALPDVPVQSGRLKASVRALGSQRDGRAVAGKSSVPYAAAIHWGRKRGGVIEARPFLWNAAQRTETQVTDKYREAVERLLEKVRR